VKLEHIPRKLMLICAHRMLSKKYKGLPLWAFVLDICATGSRSAAAICRHCGWDPDQDGSKELPPYSE
jgi:hypothetical protein